MCHSVEQKARQHRAQLQTLLRGVFHYIRGGGGGFDGIRRKTLNLPYLFIENDLNDGHIKYIVPFHPYTIYRYRNYGNCCYGDVVMKMHVLILNTRGKFA